MQVKNYTTPKLVKGPKPKSIPKGSNRKKEWAKNKWYVNFSFNGKQYRLKWGLNRNKDYDEREYQASLMITTISDYLKEGWDPENPDIFFNRKATINISLIEAIKKYLEYVEIYSTRKKTLQSYQSKLRHLADQYSMKNLSEITTEDLEIYIRSWITGRPVKMWINDKWIELKKIIKWCPKTVKNARGIFSSFFNWCIKEGYIKENPCAKIISKHVRSEIQAPERHIPLKKEDLVKVMKYLDANDKLTAFIVRMIYSTCLRPKEICELRIGDIDLENRLIKVPLSVTKNTRKTDVDKIWLEDNIFDILKGLNLSNYPKDYYLTSNSDTIVGPQSIGTNRPYKIYKKALIKLNLDGKGYTLYAIKHTSNIDRLNSGWNPAELQKANRHTKATQTDEYIKNLKYVTDISYKEIPKI